MSCGRGREVVVYIKKYLTPMNLIAGTVVAIIAAGTAVWEIQPFALATDLESNVKELKQLTVQNALGDAELSRDYYTQQLDSYALRILELESRNDLPESVKREYLLQLRREQSRIADQVERANTRVRTLRPVVPKQ
jgi:predicted anti-sigma-YlaC factor YlaD